MHGPRRLGKTFLLDRLVDAAPTHGWTAVKAELAGCTDSRAVFRELCGRIGNSRTGGVQAKEWILQRLGQFLAPRGESGGAWYQPFIGLDHETYFERMIQAMHDDTSRRWVLLIDELPIFLKALHDKGPVGVDAARNFMNQITRIRQQYPRVRWMITGSIGIEPLAQAGNYMGVLAKFQNFELRPLKKEQAKDYVKDLASSGHLPHRQEISEAEAEVLIEVVGWLAAYYLDALAQKLEGTPASTSSRAREVVEAAVEQLLQPGELSTFGPWEEHLRKHYHGVECDIVFTALRTLSKNAQGADIDGLLSAIQLPQLTRDSLWKILTRLNTEGFITLSNWDHAACRCTIRNPLLRRWWTRFPPHR
jgi:hypothetical protein